MAEPCRVDTTGWQRKVKNVMAVQAAICEKVVTFGIDVIIKKADENLKGPHYTEKYSVVVDGKKKRRTRSARGPLTNAGKFPVPIVTGMLKKSLKPIRFNTVFGAVYSDPRMASYNKLIHDGGKVKTKGDKYWIMLPRPFLQNAVDTKRPMIMAYAKMEIAKAIRTVGRS